MSNYIPMSKDEAVSFFSVLYCGEHHIPGGGVKPFGLGWSVNHIGDLSTFDADKLTRLVFLAHDQCVRVEVQQGGPRAVKICIWKRSREGSISTRHPRLEDAVAKWRDRNHEREVV